MEMEEMRRLLKLEQDAFAQEKARWYHEHNEWKVQQTSLIEAERANQLRIAQEDSRLRLAGLESQRLTLQQELTQLEARLNEIRVQISNEKNGGVGSLEWLMSER